VIKINLARQRQAGASGESRPAQVRSGGGVDQLRELPLRKVGVPILAALVATYLFHQYKDEELKKLDSYSNKLNAEVVQLQTEINKVENLEAQKDSLEEGEKNLRAKIDAIRKLVSDRADPPKLLTQLSNGIPKDVWLTEFKVDKMDISIRGASLGFNQVSDFMKNLSDSSYFVDIDLKNSQQGKDQGYEVASFELNAKRRQ
jgi:hypothetical protein